MSELYPQDKLRRLLLQGSAELFLALDPQRDLEVIARLMHRLQLPAVSLYDPDELDREVVVFAPQLVQLPAAAPESEVLIGEAWGGRWGVFFQSQVDLFSLREHVRTLMLPVAGDGSRVVLPVYDPLTMRNLLPCVSVAESDGFFGPIQAMLMEAHDPWQALCFIRQPDGQVSRIEVDLGRQQVAVELRNMVEEL